MKKLLLSLIGLCSAIEDECSPAFDLVILQDVTSSMQPLIKSLKDQLPKFAEQLGSEYPNSRIGVGFFGDKPAELGDNCYETQAPLSNDVSLAVEKLETAKAHGGGQWKENQLGAMMRAVLSPKMNWNRDVTDKNYKNKYYKKMVLLITDSAANQPPHWENYYTQHRYDGVKFHGASQLRKGFDLDDENKGCADHEYPSWSKWAKLMKAEKVLPIFVTGDIDHDSDRHTEMCSLAKEVGREDCFGYKYNRKKSLGAYYTTYAKKNGVKSKAVYYDGEIKDLWNLIVEELKAVSQDICNPTDYPTIPVASTKPTVTMTESPVVTTTHSAVPPTMPISETTTSRTTTEAPTTVATTCPPVECTNDCPICECPTDCPVPTECPDPEPVLPKCCASKKQILTST